MKEVKKNNTSKTKEDFYLSIYELIQQGLNPSKICKQLSISKQKLQYYLNTLKHSGFIKKLGYGVWEVSKPFNPKEVKQVKKYIPRVTKSQELKTDQVRGHGFQFILKFPTDLRGWKNREKRFKERGLKFQPLILGGLNRGQRIIFKGRKIWITNSSIVIYEKESYMGDSASLVKDYAIYNFLTLVRALENELEANFSFAGQYKFKVSRQHYSLVKNALAKQYNKQGKKLRVFNKRGESIFIIDNSHNLHEFEAVHPKTSVPDSEKVQIYFKEISEQEGYTPKFVTNALGKITEVQLQITETQKDLPEVIQNLKEQVKSHLALIQEYRKENVVWRKQEKKKIKEHASQTKLGRWF